MPAALDGLLQRAGYRQGGTALAGEVRGVAPEQATRRETRCRGRRGCGHRPQMAALTKVLETGPVDVVSGGDRDRPGGAVLTEQDAEWAESRCCMGPTSSAG